jgi:hypothetical protein
MSLINFILKPPQEVDPAGRPTRYNDYYVVRFLEDFTGLFPAIG